MIHRGKHPGENTLKKELWTKFDAVSTHWLRYNAVLQNTAQNWMRPLVMREVK